MENILEKLWYKIIYNNLGKVLYNNLGMSDKTLTKALDKNVMYNNFYFINWKQNKMFIKLI